jgi:hypothetical protein
MFTDWIDRHLGKLMVAVGAGYVALSAGLSILAVS